MKEKILIMDGAMGTMLQKANLTADDFGGEELEGCNENLNITRPDVIEKIHREYLEAGADIIETNTFGGCELLFLMSMDSVKKPMKLIKLLLKLQEMQQIDFSTPSWPRFVAGAMGPTTKTLSVTGGTTFEELINHYEEQACGLIDGNVDVLLIRNKSRLIKCKSRIYWYSTSL